MARTVIAELDINIDSLIKSTAELKAKIDEIRAQQKELTKSGDTASEVFVQNAADLRALTTAYNASIREISGMAQAQADAENRSKLMEIALNSEVESIVEAREQNKLLTRLRNEANTSTEEGREELRRLNEQINRNNEYIRENIDALGAQRMNVGNYRDSVIEAFEELEKNKKALQEQEKALTELRDEQEKGSAAWIYYNNQITQTNTQINILNVSMGELNDEANASSTFTQLLSGDFRGLSESAREAGGATNLMSSTLSGASKGFLNLAKSALAFLITPIGAVLGAIVLAFALVKNAMNRSEEATNKITKIFTVFGGIVNKLLKFLEPLGKFLIDGIVKGFELAGQAAETALDIISVGLSLLGLDDAAKSVSNFKNEMKTAAVEAAKLADAEAKLEKAQRQSQRIQLEYQKNAEKLRQIRDDENLTIAQRIKANDELGVVLKKQLQEELKIAQLALEVANARIKAEGQTKETLDAQAEALTTIADIQERITGQESEQLTNRVVLQKEAADKAKEIAEKRLQDALLKSRQEIDLFIAQQGYKKKSLEEEEKFNQELLDKELKDLKFRFDKKQITNLEYQTEKLNLENDYAKKSAEIAIQNAELELQAITNKNDLILENDKFLNEQLFENKKAALELIQEAELSYQKTRLENGVINEQEYNNAINLINEENRLLQEELRAERELAEQEKRILDLELKREQDQLTFEEQLAIDLERNEIAKQEELANAEKTGADKNLIEKKYADNEKKLRQEVEMAKLSLVQQGLQGAQALFKENTVAYKALAIAEATINTYKAASLALSDYTYPLGGIFAGLAIAQGLSQVSKIAGIKLESGGIVEIGGKRHSAGGTKFYGEDGTMFEAEAGEGIGVLNRSAFASFMDFNNRFNGGSSRAGFFQGGGIITQSVKPETVNLNSVVEAIQAMPAPVVAVEEIQTVGSRYVEVKQGADL